MNITTQYHELVLSGSIVQIDDSPINIVLPDRIEGDFTIVFVFVTDPAQKSVTRLVGVSKYTMKVEFINFNGMMNIGNTAPLFLGTLEKKELYLVYRVSDLARSGKLINYSFYVKKGGTNG